VNPGLHLRGGFDRDRLTWVAYLVLGWYAFLQASPGLVMPYLRAELDLDFTAAGLHVAAFAAGSVIGGLLAARLERAVGRRRSLWAGAWLMSGAVVGLTLGAVAPVTIGSVLLMGIGGGFVLVAVQALLADHHRDRRAVALTEANVAASLGYLLLIGALSLVAAFAIGWRVALLASLAVPVLAWSASGRGATVVGLPARGAEGALRRLVWIAAGVLFFTTAAEWSVVAWGASFVERAASVSPDVAVALMAAYFGGVVAGRVIGSRLARTYDPALVLAAALGVAGGGFAVFWPLTTPEQALIALGLLGVGLGNLYPFATAVTMSLAPTQAAAASGRGVAMASLAGMLAPLTVGPLADATSLSAALLVVPALLAAAAAGLVVVIKRR
jgi:MFS family permease